MSSAPAAMDASSSLPLAPPLTSAAANADGSVTGPRWPEPTAVVSSKFNAWAMPPFIIAAVTAGRRSAKPRSDDSGIPPLPRASASISWMPTPSVFAASVVASVSSTSHFSTRVTGSGRSS